MRLSNRRDAKNCIIGALVKVDSNEGARDGSANVGVSEGRGKLIGGSVFTTIFSPMMCYKLVNQRFLPVAGMGVL